MRKVRPEEGRKTGLFRNGAAVGRDRAGQTPGRWRRGGEAPERSGIAGRSGAFARALARGEATDEADFAISDAYGSDKRSARRRPSPAADASRASSESRAKARNATGEFLLYIKAERAAFEGRPHAIGFLPGVVAAERGRDLAARCGKEERAWRVGKLTDTRLFADGRGRGEGMKGSSPADFPFSRCRAAFSPFAPFFPARSTGRGGKPGGFPATNGHKPECDGNGTGCQNSRELCGLAS